MNRSFRDAFYIGFLIALIFGLMMLFARGAIAQTVATVVAVVPGANVSAGAGLASGARVDTDASGRVDLVFTDGTKVVVGPGSRLEVDSVLMQGATASRFAVTAVQGSFRFITGNSRKDAYAVATPTGTLGVRGTSFDVAVLPQETLLALFEGEVQVCRPGQRQNCAVVRGSCTIALASRDLVRGTRGRAEKRDLIAASFPFIQDQTVLREDFQTPLKGCGNRTARVQQERTKVAPEGRSAPAPEAPGPENPSIDRKSTQTRVEDRQRQVDVGLDTGGEPEAD